MSKRIIYEIAFGRFFVVFLFYFVEFCFDHRNVLFVHILP